jgi:hypothetical protein
MHVCGRVYAAEVATRTACPAGRHLAGGTWAWLRIRAIPVLQTTVPDSPSAPQATCSAGATWTPGASWPRS